MIYFNLFSIELSWSHNPSRKFNILIKLARIIFLCLLLIDLFFNLHWVDEKLSFIFFFNSLSIELL